MDCFDAFVPSELRSLPQWVRWRVEPRSAGEKPTKIPYQWIGNRRAKTDDPATWGSYALASQYLPLDSAARGLGFVFTDSGGLVGIDLDGCRDPADGTIADWAKPILYRFRATYAEVSPSQTGVKIFARGRLPTDRTGKKVAMPGEHCGIEAYQRGRFFCVTGQKIDTALSSIADCQPSLDWLWQTYLRPAVGVRATPIAVPGTNGNHDNRRAFTRAAAYLTTMPPAIQGQNGSGATFRAACELFRFGLDDAEAASLLDQFSGRCVPPWSAAELRHKLADARDEVNERGEFGARLAERNGHAGANGKGSLDGNDDSAKEISNTDTEFGEDGSVKNIPLPMRSVLRRIRKITENWPRRIQSSLFVSNEKNVNWLTSTSSLFGWLGSISNERIFWHRIVGCASREEVFSELQRTSEQYEAIATQPHEPPIPGHFYTCGEVEPGDGSTLSALLDRFCPATPIDRDLLCAALVTPAWGGPVGARPAFLLTSEFGRGVGKSKTAQMLTRVWGGTIDVSQNEEITKLKTRLLSANALALRIALLDNIKSLRFSWAELEALITSSTISGHRMYEGEGSRPNTLTWFLTLNGASLSTDMSQRCVIVKVDRPTYSASWEGDTERFIDANRDRIIADCVGFLRGQVFPLAKFSRWGAWEKDVLQRLPDPGEAQRTIMDRQSIVDVEEEEAGVIEEFFAEQLRRLNYDISRERIFIPSQVAARWLNWATNEKHTLIHSSRILSQMTTEGRVKHIECKAGRSQGGRGFVWIGENVHLMTPLDIELEIRIRKSIDQEKTENGCKSK